MSIVFNDNYKGIPLVGAAATVGSVTLSDTHLTINFSVSFKSSGSVDAYTTEFFNCAYSKTGKDIVGQAYDSLINNPRFTGGVLTI